MSEFVMGQIDVYEHYSVGKYLTGLGVSVSPSYRNRGIAQKLLEAQYNDVRFDRFIESNFWIFFSLDLI